MSKKVVIIDYGMGNLGSISNMLKYIGVDSMITSDHNVIDSAEKIILPGVGHFDSAMTNINELNLVEILRKKSLVDKVPFLGICLGMQLMCRHSEEGNRGGLGLINADVLGFNLARPYKVPHMGWNLIEPKNDNAILENLDNNSRFYFVHSYYVKTDDESNVLTYTNYGHKFVSGITNNKNIFGVQFHPEKSHKYGVTLFKNFIEKY
jgi:glutamine amidotransferase